jgi:2-phosphoglycerate kinase
VDDLRERLRHVRWLGGGSGAGKSTIAARLGDSFGLRVYGTDEAIQRHVPRSTAAQHPLLHEFLAMDMGERWVNRSPEVMLETFHGFRGEAFELIVEDLLAMPEEPLILVEGFRLLPRLVAPLLSGPNQAAWLIPTPDFRRRAFEARGFTWVIPERTTDPVRALANLLERDRLFTAQVANQAAAEALTIIDVDGTLGIEALTDRVGEALGLTRP